MPVLPLAELLTLQQKATLEVESRFPPYGFAHLDTFEPVPNLDEVRMTPMALTRVASFCGSSKLNSPTNQLTERVGLNEFKPVSELEHSYTVSRGGLLGFVLMSTTRQLAMQKLGIQSVEDFQYESPGGPKCMDAGLGSGYLAMGRLVEEAIKASRAEDPGVTDDELVEILSRSYRTLPRAFAGMANDPNKKLEKLYGIKHCPEGRQYIADELEIDPEKPYDFIMNQERVVPNNWEHASSYVSRARTCGALEHPAFGAIWQLVSRAAVKVL